MKEETTKWLEKVRQKPTLSEYERNRISLLADDYNVPMSRMMSEQRYYIAAADILRKINET